MGLGSARVGRAGRLVSWLLLACTAGGCASIVGGTMQVVSVETPDCPGARCELVNDKGRFHVASTPGTVTLVRSYNHLQVSCTRDGVHSALASIASTTKGMAFGNILFGGVIGAGVDVSTGAAYDYPQLITVPMQCPGPGAAGAAVARPARFGLQVGAASADEGGAGGEGGARVLVVDAGSAAAAAGLQPGDLVREVDGRPVTSPDALAAALAAPGSPSSRLLRVRRGAQDLTMTLAAPDPAPPADGGSEPATPPAPSAVPPAVPPAASPAASPSASAPPTPPA